MLSAHDHGRRQRTEAARAGARSSPARGAAALAAAAGNRAFAALVGPEARRMQPTATLQRQPKGGATKRPPPTAADAPKLVLSEKGDACACIIVIHNNEVDAKRTAELMQANCSYSLILLDSGTKARNISIPRNGAVDPNELFPADVSEQCIRDEKSCQDELAANAASTDKAKLLRSVQIQFFLTLKKGSRDFSIPVIALHNNAIDDTKAYREQKAKQGVTELEGFDVDKSTKATGEDQVARMKQLLERKFGKDALTNLTETARKTNIFRWCASDDLARCHIGDPDHPDNVTWVTNENDFDKLKSANVNVVFQEEQPKQKPGTTGESSSDLSTVFLVIEDLIKRQGAVDLRRLQQLLDASPSVWEALGIPEIRRLMLETAARLVRLQSLRFVNIEGPHGTGERVRNYEAIVHILTMLGLHCCGPDPGKAEGAVKQGLAK
jgi:hypothetical protein